MKVARARECSPLIAVGAATIAGGASRMAARHMPAAGSLGVPCAIADRGETLNATTAVLHRPTIAAVDAPGRDR